VAAIVPLAFAAVFYEPFTAAKQILLIGGAGAAVVLCAATARHIPVTPLWWPLGLLALTCAFGLGRATRLDTGLSLLAALVLFAAALLAMEGRSGRETLALVVSAAGALEAVLVLWQAVAGDPLFATAALPGKWRAFGTFGNPNWTGEFLAMALLVTLGRLTDRPSRAGLFTLGLIGAGLAATFARGAWVACAAGLAAMILARGGKALPRRLALALAAALAIAVAVAAALASRSDTLPYLTNLASLRGRLWMWLVTLRLIAENPLGVGLGGFGLYFPQMQARCFETPFGRGFLSSASFTPHAHNDYLQIAAEAGIPALAAAGVLVWMIARRGRRLSAEGAALGLWAAVMAMLADALFASPLNLPGSLALTAIFLGGSEAAAAAFRPVAWSRAGRTAACAAALAVCAWTWHWCACRAASEYALQRAAIAVGLRSWDAAAAALREAGAHDPTRFETHSMAGRVSLARREFPAAGEAYTRAAALGYNIDVFAGKATALWHDDQRAAAVAVLEQLAWLRPDLEWPQRRIAELRSYITAPAGRTP
jgi:O-antigen ligase